jgi:MinD superfamily P-loop ATPase
MGIAHLVVLSDDDNGSGAMIAAALASVSRHDGSVVLVDADVEHGGLAQLLRASTEETHDFVGARVATILPDKCTACGTCLQACRFGAIKSGSPQFRIERSLCQACHSCYYQCPEHAITMLELESGRWFLSASAYGALFHARLDSGQTNSGKLVTFVKLQARLAALARQPATLLVAAPAGNGGPVRLACNGADMAVLVIDPRGGVDSLDSLLGITNELRIPPVVMIDAGGVDESLIAPIRTRCRSVGVDVFACGPVKAPQYPPRDAVPHLADSLVEVWRRIRLRLRG